MKKTPTNFIDREMDQPGPIALRPIVATYGTNDIKDLLKLLAQSEKWQVVDHLKSALNQIPIQQKLYFSSNRFNFLIILRNELRNSSALFAERRENFEEIEKWAFTEMRVAPSQVVPVVFIEPEPVRGRIKNIVNQRQNFSQAEISLLHFYNNDPITEDNIDQVLLKYGWTSAKSLQLEYDYYKQRDHRTKLNTEGKNGSTLPSKKILLRIRKIIPLIKTQAGKDLASKEAFSLASLLDLD